MLGATLSDRKKVIQMLHFHTGRQTRMRQDVIEPECTTINFKDEINNVCL